MTPMQRLDGIFDSPPAGQRERLQAAWLASGLADARAPLPLHSMGEAPLVMSERLNAELGQRLRGLCSWLQARVEAGAWADDARWPGITQPDVLAADLAVVQAPGAPGGWALRWVEFQAFHSVTVTAQALHLAWQALHPGLLQGLQPHELPAGQASWHQAMHDWLAPLPGGVLLEHAPLAQTTAFDLLPTAALLGLTLAEPHQLRSEQGVLQRQVGDEWVDVPQVLNRLILHEDPQGEATARLLAQARAVRWRGHPAWFDRIHKGLLPQLPLPAEERCAPLAQWRALGRPAQALVLKSARSWGGTGVRLQVDAAELDALAATADAPHWIVQPRYQAFPLATARDGAPLYGELRCMLALPPDGPPWIAARLARLSRGGMASARSWSGLPGEGLAPVYAPPGSPRTFQADNRPPHAFKASCVPSE
ncbi:hypothetical protein LRH25_09710 [Ideonella azotifigens]|uniref:ATP-grasp domain-containing protein n=1 Tax=Ideonella azotifigens TaxID=513160 RepID=A0ABP3VNC3_9BURK|nr:hypothetical protein [Ideonella azotifigens]MCD2340620.1 hypothetical protein [Ideonella azotifigens]